MLGDAGVRSFFASFSEGSEGSEGSESFETQYRAAMESVVVVERSDRGRIAASGKDREPFLHNMLSADIRKLAPNGGCEATFLTNKGKLVAHLIVFKEEERLVLETDASRTTPLIQALSRYIISEDVTLADLDTSENSFSIEGPGASRLLSEIADVPADAIDALEHLGLRVTDRLRIAARRRDPSPRFDVAASPPDALAILEAARARGAVVAGPELAETRRIEAGRPRFGMDMDESHLPLEAGLDAAINFDKGCYIGQEYVVRLAHRGHLNRKLVGVRIEGADPPAPETAITTDGKRVGHVTSAAYSPKLEAVAALAYLRREVFEPGTEVTVGESASGRVTTLPFV